MQDSPAGGFGSDPTLPSSGLTIAAGPDVLFLAWVEGDPAAIASQVILAEFRP